MKHNKLSPDSNILWESSRMILPEHRERLIQHRKELNKRTKPERDEQALESIIRGLAAAIYTKEEVSIVVWDEYEDRVFQGKIIKLDQINKRIKVENEEGYSWILLEDIMQIEGNFEE